MSVAGGSISTTAAAGCEAGTVSEGQSFTDGSVLLHRARGQAVDVALQALSCRLVPRYSLCGYPSAPMWLRMQSRSRWRQQYQTKLPLCDVDSWTSLQGQKSLNAERMFWFPWSAQTPIATSTPPGRLSARLAAAKPAPPAF